jgi:membrane protein implicated in regulation of membrane protease activity
LRDFPFWIDNLFTLGDIFLYNHSLNLELYSLLFSELSDVVTFFILTAMTFFDFITSPLMGVYFICAVFGGTLMVLQLVMMIWGAGDTDSGDFDSGGDSIGDADSDGVGDTDGNSAIGEHSHTVDIFKVLSLRTMIAGITFFGLGGLAGLTGGTTKLVSVILAIASGLIAIYFVYYLYLSVANLKSDGSISEKTLVGSFGNVYIKIPAAGAGTGKVLVNQQERTMEYEAMTAGNELKAGTPIVVVRIVSPTTVEVKTC